MYRIPIALLLAVTLPALGDCPAGKNAWRDWSREKVARLFDDGFREWNYSAIVDRLAVCEPPKDVAACLANVSRFGQARWWSFQRGHSLGLEMTDRRYYESLPYPDMLELPAALTKDDFLRLLDDELNPESIDKALKHVEKASPEWIAFPYRSRHLPTPDSTWALGRFFVYVPGPDYDRYLQFGLRHEKGKSPPHGLSMVTIQKTDPVTRRPLARPVARLKDFWRLRDADGKVTVSTRLKEVGRLENCYDCHKTALLPITPDPAFFDGKRFGPRVAAVNLRMAAQGGARLAGLDAEAYGPGMGPAIKRGDDFLLECSAKLVTRPERLRKLAAAMNCARCHDGETRGKLDFPSGRFPQPETGKSLSYHYVVDYHRMPPGAQDLTEDERHALHRCLYEELYGEKGLLRAWLAQDACWAKLP